MKDISGMQDSHCSDTPKVTGHEHEGRHKMSDRLPEHLRQIKDVTVKKDRNLRVLTSASRSSRRAGPTVSTKRLP
jgi:hypothetical protein